MTPARRVGQVTKCPRRKCSVQQELPGFKSLAAPPNYGTVKLAREGNMTKQDSTMDRNHVLEGRMSKELAIDCATRKIKKGNYS